MYSDWEERHDSAANGDRKLALREPLTQLTTGIISGSVVSPEYRPPSALEPGWPGAFDDAITKERCCSRCVRCIYSLRSCDDARPKPIFRLHAYRCLCDLFHARQKQKMVVVLWKTVHPILVIETP